MLVIVVWYLNMNVIPIFDESWKSYVDFVARSRYFKQG